MDLVTRIISKQESLKSFRTPWENLWQDCAEYVNPNRGDFSTLRYRGDTNRYEKIFDTTAPLANENLAAAGIPDKMSTFYNDLLQTLSEGGFTLQAQRIFKVADESDLIQISYQLIETPKNI